ncbi:hypothetical protein O5175_21595 [Escherichia coli]|nr:hypothetical protein [Escherichia coli]
MAFQQLVEFGPVGVLQGPPGTGKTTFILKIYSLSVSTLRCE